MKPRLGLLAALALLLSAAGAGGQGRRPVPLPQAGPAPPPAAQPRQPPAPYFRGEHPYIAPPAPPASLDAKGVASAIPSVTEGEILALLRPETPPNVPDEIANAYRLRVKNRYRLLLGLLVVYQVPQQREALDVIDLLKLERWILIAQENQRFQLVGRGPPGSGGLQYATHRTGIEQAWRWVSGRGVTVALIDTGVDRDHRALRGKVAEQMNLLGAVSSDPGVHATALAGIIAAEGNMQGAAPGVRLLVLRAFHSNPARPLLGIGTSESITRALDIAVRRRAKVINLSFGGPQDELIALSVQHTIGSGITLVAAAGNDGANARPSYPAAFAGVIAVTATDHEDRLYPAASRGRYITVAAPGVEIFTTAPGDRYHFLSGTSMAAAHVTGVVALLLEASPGLGPREVKSALERSAVDLGPVGPDADFGAGRIDALKVLKYRTRAAATGD